MSDEQSLVYVLSDLLHGSLASIEILPGSLKDWEDVDIPPGVEKPSLHFPFVLVDGNLGIPKKTLCVLYKAAVNLPWKSSDIQTTDAVSTVLLLLNPAHQTALNLRRRLIEATYLSAEQELRYTELIARGSPECGKQSMIWDHRRWCFRQLYGIMGESKETPYLRGWASSEEMQIFPKMNPTAIQHEINIIYHTCETYPRNYHAWSHWHFVINVCYASIHFSDDTATQRDFFGIITHEYIRLQEWVNLHVSDYSAVHQLYQTQNLVRLLERTRSQTMNVEASSAFMPLIDHALSLLAAYPTHETLWMYLRICLADLPPKTCSSILERVKAESAYDANHYAKQLFTWHSRLGRESLSPPKAVSQ